MQRGDRVAGRFEIQGEAAQGGMGAVYRARDHRSKRDVALKVMNDVDGANAARFLREAALLATIQHPNVVQYVTHGAIPDGPHYLVMEWVDGETLARRLAQGGVDLARAVAIARDVARALVALHARSIVHRDIKPSNLMLVNDQTKLVDFGVARQAVTMSRLTRTGTMIGTAGYMAPEQARGDSDIDGRADLFALGCVLYECVTGAAAFRADSTFALRAKVLLHDPPAPRTLRLGVPAPLDALVTELLARDPARRPRDASEVERRLGELGEPPASMPRAVTTRGAATQTSESRPVPTYAVLLAAAPQTDVAADIAVHAGVAAASVQAFDGGALITCASASDGARIALALEPLGPVVVGYGDSPDAAIDRGARLVEQIDLAAVTSGSEPSGAWIDARIAGDVDASWLAERSGERVRLVRRRAS